MIIVMEHIKGITLKDLIKEAMAMKATVSGEMAS